MTGPCHRLGRGVSLALLAAATFLPAPAGSYLDFDGINDRVTVPYNPSFPTEVFTAAAWIRTTPPPGRRTIIGRGEDDSSRNLVWQLFVASDGTLQVMLEDAADNNLCYPTPCQGNPQATCTAGDVFVSDDVWHHVAVTRDGFGELVIYIDGDERTTCPSTGVPSSNNAQDLTIGCTHGFIGPPPGGEQPAIWFFPGEIDEPAMWNVALSAAEVAGVFLAGVDPGDVGLVGYWNIDEGSGQVVADLSPAANHGFLGAQSTPDSADPLWVTLVGPGAVPDGALVTGTPLTIVKNATDPMNLDLNWGMSCSPVGNDYAVYEGPLGFFDEHTAYACTTAGAIDLTITPGGDDRYYLVVPLDDDAEGSYGTGVGGAPRPRSTAACRALAVADSCD